MKFTLNGLKLRISPDPTIETAEYWLNIAKRNEPNEIESIGGGSTIDIGKYIAWKLKIPHTAIPTTAGSGSEATKYAVFIKDGKKFTLEDNNLIPDNYILNPELVVSLPPFYTASSGLDALCHAFESWWSPNTTEESRRYSLQATGIIINSLYDSWRIPDNLTLRMNMLRAANYGGKAINITRTSICHAISYPLTTKQGIPHGFACAYTLPIFMRYFEFSNKSVKLVERLIKTITPKMNIKIDDEIIKEALNSERVFNTPKVITKELLERIL